jgi:hypothetical protein
MPERRNSRNLSQYATPLRPEYLIDNQESRSILLPAGFEGG